MVGGISGIRASVNYPWLWVIKQCKSMGIWRDFPLTVHCLGWCHIITWYPFYLAGFYRWVLNVNCLLFFGELHPYISRVTSLHFYPTFAPPKKNMFIFSSWRDPQKRRRFLRLNSVVPAMARWVFFAGHQFGCDGFGWFFLFRGWTSYIFWGLFHEPWNFTIPENEAITMTHGMSLVGFERS